MAELVRLQKVCAEVRAQYERATRPVIAVAGLAAVGGADDDCAAGLRLVNAWLGDTQLHTAAAGGTVNPACVRTAHADDAIPPLDATTWAALFDDGATDPNDAMQPAVQVRALACR